MICIQNSFCTKINNARIIESVSEMEAAFPKHGWILLFCTAAECHVEENVHVEFRRLMCPPITASSNNMAVVAITPIVVTEATLC